MGIDISGIDFEPFINSMHEAAAMKPSVASLAEEFKKLHDVIDSIKIGDTISSETFNELFPGMEDYFALLADGSYRLIVNAEEFKEIVHQTSLDKFKDLLNENQTYYKDLTELDKNNEYGDKALTAASTDDSIIKSEVFEAIKDTNKTIYIESNGIQWVFNGKNIKSPKDIDTRITLSKIDTDVLKEKIGNFVNKGIVVNFKDNGELPGVALVKIKTDYALRDYLKALGKMSTILCIKKELLILNTNYFLT